jgi:hypothetical protein
MKIVKLIGGIGNQMFQYALYESLKYTFPREEIMLDYRLFNSYKRHNGLELERVFGLNLPQASFRELLKVTRPVPYYNISRIIRKILPARKTECLEEKDYTFKENVLIQKGNFFFDGYWQNYHYFQHIEGVLHNKFIFQPELSKQNKEIVEIINKSDSVGIHIRRGDFLKSKLYFGICDINYYRNSISYIKKRINNPVFFIFSDDINWCRNNIDPLIDGQNPIYVDWNIGSLSFVDMQLMSLCKYNIIANSSFSWWAAWLNQYSNKIIIAPKKWINADVNCKFQMPDWILF